MGIVIFTNNVTRSAASHRKNLIVTIMPKVDDQMNDAIILLVGRSLKISERHYCTQVPPVIRNENRSYLGNVILLPVNL